ncbi:MAG: hypothetical protein JKY93_11335 [Gammaproteobacteria bacterium]|nr:hypothetical protein [Gammaproteobacteria bacterium]
MFILAVDQGTLSTRAMLFNQRGDELASAQQKITLDVQSKQKIEQNADEILKSVNFVIDSVLEKAHIAVADVHVMGIATQRSSVLAWDKITGQALSPVISWQDTRASAWLKQFSGQTDKIHHLSGLRLSAHYGASKMRWLLDSELLDSNLLSQQKNMIVSPLISFLLFNLAETKPILIDDANASRTLLWDVSTRSWSDYLLKLFSISKAVLPKCRPTQDMFGQTKHGISITALNGDQTAALYAEGEPQPERIYINMGTGAFVLMPVQQSEIVDTKFTTSGLLAGISSSDKDTANYYMEGTVNGAAAALLWFADKRNGLDVEAVLKNNGFADDAEIPLFINTVAGLGSPWWKPGIEPCFYEKELAEVDTDIAIVSILESIVFLLQCNIDVMCSIKRAIEVIKITGGLSNIDLLCQKIANLSQIVVHRSENHQATAKGIAYLAAGKPKAWGSGAEKGIFMPVEDDCLKRRYQCFVKIIKRL